MAEQLTPTRRQLLFGAAAVGSKYVLPLSVATSSQRSSIGRTTVFVEEFGARSSPGFDNTAAIQAAIGAVEARGGGTVVISKVYQCGVLVISGAGLTLAGAGAWLINARLVVRASAEDLRIEGLSLLDNRRDPESYLLDVSGRNCSFHNLTLIKEPIAGGYQMYVRQDSERCLFEGLTIKGSNGIFIAGRQHVFRNFNLQSTLSLGVGGDDAFVVKAPDSHTSDILIENGKVTGFAAVLSIGSEVGVSGTSEGSASVRRVTVRNVVADRCSMVVFIKPGALIYDYRNGLVEEITISNVHLDDRTGFKYTSGIMLMAARGATIRGVRASSITVNARAASQGVLPTSAIDISVRDIGAPATIRDIDLQVSFSDPFRGAANQEERRGHPIDHAVRVEKARPAAGTVANISLDIAANGTRFGGIFVGAGLDGAVTIRRARLEQVGQNPPSSLGGGGIWSDSRITVRDAQIAVVNGAMKAGRGFDRSP